MTTKRFVIGDEVVWTSQAGGYTRTKSGTIARILAPGENPPRMGKNRNPGASRNHESYVVHVKGVGHYWPRVEKLALCAARGDADDAKEEP